MKPLTKEWLAKAEADLRSARRLAAARPTDHDIVCFHSQQSAEKYLKGLLQECGVRFPRTHFLEELFDLLVVIEPTFKSLRAVGVRLSRYAVEYRYPGIRADKRKAVSAVAGALRIRAAVRQRLGLRQLR